MKDLCELYGFQIKPAIFFVQVRELSIHYKRTTTKWFGNRLCAGTDVRGCDRAGTGAPAGCQNQPEQSYAGYGTCAEKEGGAADTGRQRKAKAANVPFGASVWNGEVVPRRTLFAAQGKGESRSGAGDEFSCLQHDESDESGGGKGSDRGYVRGAPLT